MNTRCFLAALAASVVLLITVTLASAKPEFPYEYSEPFPGQGQQAFLNQSEIDESDLPLKDALTPDQELELEIFITKVTTSEANRITGLFVPEYGGYTVVQQPAGNDASVSPEEGVLTQFRRPAADGIIGLLAHNYAAGKSFDRFEPGSLVYVIYGDGTTDGYRLTKTIRFQAVNGKSTTTDFIDLANGEVQTVDQVYQQVYAGEPHLTLQTCIQKLDDVNWGRLFILAEPVL